MFVDNNRMISVDVIVYNNNAKYEEITESGHNRNLLTSEDFIVASSHNDANRNYLNQPECLVPTGYDYVMNNCIVEKSNKNLEIGIQKSENVRLIDSE